MKKFPSKTYECEKNYHPRPEKNEKQKVDVLWSALKIAIKPESDSQVSVEFLRLALLWDFIPEGKALCKNTQQNRRL